jgi:ppGpp synthetase/RelA/SpoT-type nucleotidyltranferase
MTASASAEFERYRAARPAYEDFAGRAKEIMVRALDDTRTPYQAVSSRAKEPISVFRKLLLKIGLGSEKYAEHGLNALDDRVGVRVVVATREDADRVVEIATRAFIVDEDMIDRKSLAAPPNELRYLGIHVPCVLREAARSGVDGAISSMTFELQVHTLAESGWAVVSHPIVYKPYGSPPSHELASRVYRSVALVSLFDSEVMESLRLQRESADYWAVQMLRTVDRLFEPWRSGPSDDDLSLVVLDVVCATLTANADIDEYQRSLESFVDEHRGHLDAILQPRMDANPLMTQPEILALVERIDRAKNVLRTAWRNHGLDDSLLCDLADSLGEPYLVD